MKILFLLSLCGMLKILIAELIDNNTVLIILKWQLCVSKPFQYIPSIIDVISAALDQAVIEQNRKEMTHKIQFSDTRFQEL